VKRVIDDKLSSGRRHGYAPVVSVLFAVAVVTAAAARTPVTINLGHPPDGQQDVSQADAFGRARKISEGRAFIEKLRARSRDGRGLDERLSVDMAEYAFLRHDFNANRDRCLACLKAVYDAAPSSFWGWAAYTFLTDAGVTVPRPTPDPLRGLGAFGDGVVNLQPARLRARAVPRETVGLAARLLTQEQAKIPSRRLSTEDLRPGSAVRRAILRARLVDVCTPAKIDALLALEGGDVMFRRLWLDDALLEDFLLSGPVFNAPLALETLMTLWLNDCDGGKGADLARGGWSAAGIGRRATVAVAINAVADDSLDGTVRHWAAYRRIGLMDRFVADAKKRDCREWRFIVRRPVDPAETLYLNSTEKFPTHRRLRVGRFGALRVPYRKKNCFGVSKWAKNDEFMRPWTASGWPRQYIRTRVGGVCTEQSRWAALCANAHGIMAERAGQPGHCSWLIREENGQWKIISNIRRYTAGVFRLWGNGFQYIQSTERAFADRAAHDESELLRFAGRVREAARRCPYNYPAWRAWTDQLKARKEPPEVWRAYLQELLDTQPEGRLVTWDFAWEALQAMAAGGMDKKSLAEETGRVFLKLPQPKVWIAEEMNFNGDALSRFLRRFRGDDELTMKILAVALKANGTSPDYLPLILNYALSRYANDKEKQKRIFALASSFSGDGKVDWRLVFSLKGVCQNRTLFRSLAAFRNNEDPPTGTTRVATRDYGADLVSDDALVRTSSAGKNDRPHDHARVSDATPYEARQAGFFETAAETSPWAVVELGGETKLYGVTVAGRDDSVKVSVSLDGEEWTPCGELCLKNGKGRLDLRKTFPEAKFVKVGRENGPKRPLSLLKILVYGRRLY
jgi:hypothetical protein